MDHYLDVHLLADPEFGHAQLMSALFAKLHRLLAQAQRNDIGVSFPKASKAPPNLGTLLRLHGSHAALEWLVAEPWLKGMRDHVAVGTVSPVPSSAGHLAVRRVQAKSSPERLRRRQMKRKGWTEEQARAAIPDSVAEALKLPFVAIRSTSTGQAFRLFIDQRPTDSAQSGTFNAYGLSTSASLPRF